MVCRFPAGALAVLPLLAACYVEQPLLSPAPAPNTRVSLVLNDQGRYEAAPQIGPFAMRVEGAVLQATDSDYLVEVSDVIDIRGTRNKWAGETVPLQRRYVAMAYERRLHRGRSYALVGAMAALFVSAVIKFDLFGFASGSGGGGPPGGPPDDQ
jgi:hypothetical protein